MKHSKFPCFISVCLSVILWIQSPVLLAQNALDIVRKANEKMRGKSSHVLMTIVTIRPEWKRSMEIEAWMKGTELSLIRILSPAKDKGIIFLKKKKEVWSWYPTLERSIKLPPSMMSQSWMGTDFTNDDLVKESSVLIDYRHHIRGDTIFKGRDCHIIEMIPLPEAAVVWGKVIVYIDKRDFIELQSLFYDEEGILMNTMVGFDIRQMGDRILPTGFEMIPADKKNQKTEMHYKKIEFDITIPDSFFSIETMRNML